MTELTPAECISFFGPDGCGKSVIAEQTRNLLLEEGFSAVVLGGSSYSEWLSDDIAERFCGETIYDYQAPQLYEAIAAACYGYAQELVSEGTHVLLESDPYLKRMVWAHLEEGEGADEYCDNFESYMTERLGEEVAPQTIVVVELQEEIASPQEAAKTTLARIKNRGVVTNYDPTNLEQGEQIHIACERVKREVIIAKKYPRIPDRLQTILNPECVSQEVVEKQHRKLARSIVDLSLRGMTNDRS